MPDKHEVGGSSPLGPTSAQSAQCRIRNAECRMKDAKNGEKQNPIKWGCSSAGRAPALQAGGHGFESHHLHQAHKVRNAEFGMRNAE